MLYIKDQKCTFWKAENKGKYATVTLSTSRQDKRDNEWKNSNWSFVRFVGKAFDKIDQLEERDNIIIQAGLSKEKYKDKDGKDAWPQQPQFVVFNFEFVKPKETGTEDGSDDLDQEQLPF